MPAGHIPTMARREPIRPSLQVDPNCFENACRHAKLADVTPHTLRHAFANRLRMQGAGDRTLQALGRWKEPKMIRRYVHLSQEHLREAVEKLAEDSPTIFTTPVREAELAAAAKLSSAK